jgi:hypothetical protein
MKKFVIILCCLIAYAQTEVQEVMAIFPFYYGESGPPKPNEVHIGNTIIVMPIGKIFLVRKDSEYCAVKFTKVWSENTSEISTLFVAAGSDEYALYESYYQGDKSGDFSKKNVQFNKAKLSYLKPRGIGRLAFTFGNQEIKCGAIKLSAISNSISFYGSGQEAGDYGIELAPTKWTDISQVNVFEPRLRWYRYDENRKGVNIPVDKLWEDKENKK